MPTLVQVNREERQYNLAVRAKAKGVNCIRGACTGIPPEGLGKRANRKYVTVAIRSSVSYRNALASGEAVMRVLQRREEFHEMQGQTIQHVKNGKPLTAHGAKLLGVAWDA